LTTYGYADYIRNHSDAILVVIRSKGSGDSCFRNKTHGQQAKPK